MTDGSASTGSVPGGADATGVTVTIPADPARLPVLRSVAAALAVSLDFDIDTMADLRMAVDELTATVVTRALPGSQVRVDLVADAGAVTVRATASVSDPAPIDRGSFGWMVLTTLAESVEESVQAVDGAGLRVQVSMTVRPSRAAR